MAEVREGQPNARCQSPNVRREEDSPMTRRDGTGFQSLDILRRMYTQPMRASEVGGGEHLPYRVGELFGISMPH